MPTGINMYDDAELGSPAGWTLIVKVGPVKTEGESKMKKGGRQKLSSEVGTQMLALAFS